MKVCQTGCIVDCIMHGTSTLLNSEGAHMHVVVLHMHDHDG